MSPKKQAKRGPGRPATGQSPTITVRLPADLISALEAVLGEGERQSDFVRAAIEREVKRRSR
jgi:Arc/MetJ-type ribon-helix-helix transcriptional regulator